MDAHLRCGKLAMQHRPSVTLKPVNMTKLKSNIRNSFDWIREILSPTAEWDKCGWKKTLLCVRADIWPRRSSTMRKTSPAVFALLAHMRGSDNRRRRGKSY